MPSLVRAFSNAVPSNCQKLPPLSSRVGLRDGTPDSLRGCLDAIQVVSGRNPARDLCAGILGSPKAPIQIVCPAFATAFDLRDIYLAKFGEI